MTAITVKLSVESPEKFLSVIWNFVTKTQLKFVTLSSCKNVEIFFQKREKTTKNSYEFQEVSKFI